MKTLSITATNGPKVVSNTPALESAKSGSIRRLHVVFETESNGTIYRLPLAIPPTKSYPASREMNG